MNNLSKALAVINRGLGFAVSNHRLPYAPVSRRIRPNPQPSPTPPGAVGGRTRSVPGVKRPGLHHHARPQRRPT